MDRVFDLLKTDPLGCIRGTDNVMPIFPEEQPVTWLFAKEGIKGSLKESGGAVDFLDVGTGCGVFAILGALEFRAGVVAIDRNIRAIGYARENAANFSVSENIRFLHSQYLEGTAKERSVKVIALNPPYHIYPPDQEQCVSEHARGGSDGMGEFKNQLRLAGRHLAKDGMIFFNQMCLGKDGVPEFVGLIPKLVGSRVSLVYTEILQNIPTRAFLEGVYGAKYQYFTRSISGRYPEIFYTAGIIRNDKKGNIDRVGHSIDLKGRGWKDRIALHKKIRKTAEQRKKKMKIR